MSEPLAAAAAKAPRRFGAAEVWALVTALCCAFGFYLRWLNAGGDIFKCAAASCWAISSLMRPSTHFKSSSSLLFCHVGW